MHLLFHFLVQMIFGVSHIQQWTLFPLYERVVTPCPQMLFISLNGFQWNFERFFINWWHCASPVSYFDANDFWGFLYHTIDLAMSVIIFNSISYLFLSIFIQQRDYWVLLMVWVCRHCHCCFLSIDTMFFCSRVLWYSIQYYLIEFVSDLWQVCGPFRVLRFPPSIKLTATI